VSYALIAAPGPVVIEVRPLVAGRDIQALHYDNHVFRTTLQTGPDWLAMQPYDAASRLVLQHGPATLVEDGLWYYQFELPREIEQGREGHEDLYTPGILVHTLRPGQRFHLVAAAGGPEEVDPEALLTEERGLAGGAACRHRPGVPGQYPTRPAGRPWFGRWGGKVRGGLGTRPGPWARLDLNQ
jgi:hypothetical protein